MQDRLVTNPKRGDRVQVGGNSIFRPVYTIHSIETDGIRAANDLGEIVTIHFSHKLYSLPHWDERRIG
jgi:hypothetical protein